MSKRAILANKWSFERGLMELCYGIIPIRLHKGFPEVLLVHHCKGSYWGFSKGHAEKGEEPRKAAARELFEETGLNVKKFFEYSFSEEYSFERQRKPIKKSVQYFVAEVTGEIVIQREEIREAEWFTLEKALSIATFSETKTLIEKLKKQLFHKGFRVKHL